MARGTKERWADVKAQVPKEHLGPETAWDWRLAGKRGTVEVVRAERYETDDEGYPTEALFDRICDVVAAEVGSLGMLFDQRGDGFPHGGLIREWMGFGEEGDVHYTHLSIRMQQSRAEQSEMMVYEAVKAMRRIVPEELTREHGPMVNHVRNHLEGILKLVVSLNRDLYGPKVQVDVNVRVNSAERIGTAFHKMRSELPASSCVDVDYVVEGAKTREVVE